MSDGGGLLDRQIARALALENAINIARRTPPLAIEQSPLCHSPNSFAAARSASARAVSPLA